MKTYTKVVLINAALFLLIVYIVDQFLYKHRLYLPEMTYIHQFDIAIAAKNLNQNVYFDKYKDVYGETYKSKCQIITDDFGSRIGQYHNKNELNKNIVLIGDSFSFGCYADYKSTLTGLLETNQNKFNTYNFSANGAASNIYPDLLKYFMQEEKLSPNILIVGLYVDMEIGDIPRNIAINKYGRYKAYSGFPVSPSLYKDINDSLIKSVFFSSELFLRNNFSIFNILFKRNSPNTEFATSTRETLSSKNIEQYSNLISSNIQSIKEASKLPERNIIIYFVPSASNLKYKHDKAKGITRNDDIFYATSDNLWRTIKLKLEQENYNVIDPQHLFEDAFINHGVYPFVVDGHFNEEGFKIVFDLINKNINSHTWCH